MGLTWFTLVAYTAVMTKWYTITFAYVGDVNIDIKT